MATRDTETQDSVQSSGGNEVAAVSNTSGSARSRNVLREVFALHRRGPRNLANLSIYAAGLSGLWTALGTPLLPIKVEEILANGGSSLLWLDFTEDDKNGALGIVSLIGLAVAALTQPISGILSDKRTGSRKRLPFLMIGALGMAGSVLFLGLAGTLVALIILNLLIQGMGNFAQGAANGLISDHVSPKKKGTAAGALNLSRVIGAGLLTGIVLWMMARYDAETAPGWMMAALVTIASVAVLSTLWTVTSLWRNTSHSDAGETRERTRELATHPEPEEPPQSSNVLPHDNYLRFLIALTVVIAGFSALQLYSFFYLEDVIGLENPADGALAVLIATAVATGLTVMPAGKLADRIGRDPMIYTGGLLGIIATVILIFATSIVLVVFVGVLIGVVIGLFLTVSWALANDLVSRRNAARDLGYASVAVLIGSAISRISGLGVDRLNQVQDALGYQVVLGAVAASFLIASVLMTHLDARKKPEEADSLQRAVTE